ncbi:MAG: AraC family transcriptional regulator [Pseudomonadota bacterium]|nr:AraC family transcriptional regulator [Pseudomonadota bacterium]
MYSLQTAEMAENTAARGAAASVPTRRPVLDLSQPRFEPDSTRRAQLGQIGIDLRASGRQHCAQLTPNATTVHLVVPIAGSAVGVSHQEFRQLKPGAALLLTKRQRTDFLWTAESCGLVLHIPTAVLQQGVAASFPEPRRLAAVSHALALEGAASELANHLSSALRILKTGEIIEQATDRLLVQALIAALRTVDENEFFPISRSLQRASEHLMAHPDSRCAPEELARIAGVTLPTLQRNVKTCLGIPLAKFVEQVRLTWVREQLMSSMESRSIAGLAEACGYSSPSTLARSYQRLFGETPTQTRARAFAATSR